MAWHCYEANHQEAYDSPSLASESMTRSINSQNLSDIAAMRMTYLMYSVAWIYVRDSTPRIGYLRLRRYRQEQVYHSRGIKPHTLDKS